MRPVTASEAASITLAGLLPTISLSLHRRFVADLKSGMPMFTALTNISDAADEIRLRSREIEYIVGDKMQCYDMSDARSRAAHGKRRRKAAAAIENILLAHRVVGRDCGQP